MTGTIMYVNGELPSNAANKESGNSVKLEGRGSTGRTIPNNILEQAAMNNAKIDPLSQSIKIMEKMSDLRWSGWDKYQIVYYTSDNKITIHFVYDPINHLFDDFKFVFPKQKGKVIMKVIFKECTNEYLTYGKEYLVFEIYMNFDRQTMSFRLINDKGIPSMFNSDEFNYTSLSLDNMVYLKGNNTCVITLAEIYLLLKDSEDINIVWEEYFDNNKAIINDVNRAIMKYASEKKISVVEPSPYGS